jgi:hypothetical protein
MSGAWEEAAGHFRTLADEHRESPDPRTRRLAAGALLDAGFALSGAGGPALRLEAVRAYAEAERFCAGDPALEDLAAFARVDRARSLAFCDPDAAAALFDEVARAHGGSEDPRLRSAAVHALVGKAETRPEHERVGLLARLVDRFGDDASPLVRLAVAEALAARARALLRLVESAWRELLAAALALDEATGRRARAAQELLSRIGQVRWAAQAEAAADLDRLVALLASTPGSRRSGELLEDAARQRADLQESALRRRVLLKLAEVVGAGPSALAQLVAVRVAEAVVAGAGCSAGPSRSSPGCPTRPGEVLPADLRADLVHLLLAESRAFGLALVFEEAGRLLGRACRVARGHPALLAACRATEVEVGVGPSELLETAADEA